MPVKVNYLAGRDIATDVRQGGIASDIAKKKAAIDVVRSSDFGGTVVGGMDRVSLEQRIASWTNEVDETIDSLKAFEVF